MRTMLGIKVFFSSLLFFTSKLHQICANGSHTVKSFPITTLINAKWDQTPLYLEIAEYLFDENPNLYWTFVEKVGQLDSALNEYDTDSTQYNIAITAVTSIVSKLQLPLLKLVVSMHSLTPRIQAHLQIADEVLKKGDCKGHTFVQVGMEIACSLMELKEKLTVIDTSLDQDVETYSFDHIFPGSENNTRTVVLYGDLGSNEFSAYHKLLATKAQAGTVRYITRHYIKVRAQRRVRLSGYGVELYLKSTEYKSQDDAPKQADEHNSENLIEDKVHGFIFKQLKSKFPTLSHSLDRFHNNLVQRNEEIAQLKAWEFQDLGLQAASNIADIQGEEALQILQYTAQNFPILAKTLLNQKVTDMFRNEIKHNTEILGRSLNFVPSEGALFINGLFFDSDSVDLSALVESIRAEARILQSLHENQLSGKEASALLELDFAGSSQQDFAIDIRDSAVIWINDIEHDPEYRRWPSSVMDLLRPTFPGMLRNIRKNIFNLVLVVDPLQTSQRSLIKLAESFVVHMAPVHLGLVFDARLSNSKTSDDYIALFCAFNYISQKRHPRAALSFLTDIFTSINSAEIIKKHHIRKQLKKSFENLSTLQVDDILGEDSDFDYGRQLSREFVSRLGFKQSPQALLNGVPMQQNLLISDNDFEEAIFTEVIQQTTALQKNIYRGDLTDSNVVIDYLMDQPHVMPRLNQRILNTGHSKFLDLTGLQHNDLSNVRALSQLSIPDMTATLMSNIKYFSHKHSTERIGSSDVHFLTLWIVADLEEADGRELFTNALEYLKSADSVRVAFIPNTESVDFHNRNINHLVWTATQTLSGQIAIEFVLKMLKSKNKEKLEIPATFHDILPSTDLHLKMLRVYCQRVLGLRKSERLVIGNGEIFGPLSSVESFSTEDFGLIERFYSFQYGDKIRKVLLQSVRDDNDRVITSDTLLKLYTTLVPRQSKARFNIPDDIKEDYSVIKLPAKQENLPQFEITAIIDPVSRAAQKLAPILILLRNTINCNMRVILTPVGQHSDMPIKNFYRYVVEPEVQFSSNGKLSEGPFAKFTGLPANPLLTQNLQVSENWLVEAVRSVYDLDNIKLSEIGGPVHSEFELEFLLLEGHCFDSASGAPPRGLQLTLGTRDNPTLVDTIVMANLGYFQLKANPGIWRLQLREGKSNDIYAITNAEGPNTIYAQNYTKIVLSSLRSHVIKVRVSKKAAMQHADLLGDEEEFAQTGIWNSIANSFSSSSGITSNTDTETINIFSVASGHLYERLLRIMMISLLKHTKSPVKFWFLKNYLSPQFTDFLPHMAREYGFHYELVQYKWPRWLHQQTEKQRTIWGYKILFLDVLFPLNVRKIIFVDADAIVRTDLKELYSMDLDGAPYAYTPFCDSRKEMEGFRFWKQGYWRSHLMGRRYHISALYVVDLKRFRKVAAGDRLRGQYQALSQDSNSLANLDQDLPNNMIHQVAIKSLPDEWLWCQTWCSDSSFKKAKIIDLCNNPLTKEAKLTAAQRIVPEWKDYDAEIKKLLAKIEDHEYVGNEISRDTDEDMNSSELTDSHSKKHSEL